MRLGLFIDTGPFYARYVLRDSHHEESLALWEKARQKNCRCLTTNFVLEEIISLLVYRFGTPSALRAAREIYGSHFIEIVPMSLDLELKALDWLERFSDQDFSMTDATSFALMKERDLKIAYTFDHHFEIAGFQPFRD